MKNLLALTLVLMLSGCGAGALVGLGSAAVDMATDSPMDDGLHIENEMTFGDKKQTVATQLGDRVSAQAVTIVNETSILMMILLIMGWMAPSPQYILKWFFGGIGKIVSGTINLFRKKKDDQQHSRLGSNGDSDNGVDR